MTHCRSRLAPDVPAAMLTRRQTIRLLGAASLLMVGGSACHGASPTPPATPEFTPEEVSALNALADAVIPPNADPGGAALGAVAYIERLITAFEGGAAAIFANGPFSGRAPFPAPSGVASGSCPPDDFTGWVELDRVNAIAWQLNVLGSSAVPGGAPNESLLGTVVGIRAHDSRGARGGHRAEPRPSRRAFARRFRGRIRGARRGLPESPHRFGDRGRFRRARVRRQPGRCGVAVLSLRRGQPAPRLQPVERYGLRRTPRLAAEHAESRRRIPAAFTADVIDLLDLVTGVLGGTVAT